MDFLNDFFREIDRARGMVKTGVVILDYFWPIIIVIGVLIAILYIRSYLNGMRTKNHGKRIENLEKGAAGNWGSGANLHVHCHTANFLQTTPDVARLLVNGQQLPQPQALPPGKSTGDQVAAARAAAEKRRIEEAERIRQKAEGEERKRRTEKELLRQEEERLHREEKWKQIKKSTSWIFPAIIFLGLFVFMTIFYVKVLPYTYKWDNGYWIHIGYFSLIMILSISVAIYFYDSSSHSASVAPPSPKAQAPKQAHSTPKPVSPKPSRKNKPGLDLLD